jgi:hypothetical protein
MRAAQKNGGIQFAQCETSKKKKVISKCNIEIKSEEATRKGKEKRRKALTSSRQAFAQIENN